MKTETTEVEINEVKMNKILMIEEVSVVIKCIKNTGDSHWMWACRFS